MERSKQPETEHVGSRCYQWVFAGFAAMAILLVGFEHRVHLLAWLPWLILLACPIMHLFMHKHHGLNRSDDDEKSGDAK